MNLVIDQAADPDKFNFKIHHEVRSFMGSHEKQIGGEVIFLDWVFMKNTSEGAEAWEEEKVGEQYLAHSPLHSTPQVQRVMLNRLNLEVKFAN